MDPIIADAYSTVLSGAPYVIAAYAAILVVFVILCVAMFLKSKKTQGDIDALRETIERREHKERDLQAK